MFLLSLVRRFGLSVAIFGVTTAQATPILLVNDGILVGAKNVYIGDSLYDVKFSDGTCAGVFKGCDPSAFTFHNAAEASLAADALLNQVFVDNTQGLFDSRSDISYNCGSNIQCDSIVPYSLDGASAFRAVVARNMSQMIPSYQDSVLFSAYNTLYDTKRYYGGIGLESFAVFTVARAEIPEPDTIGLLALAVGMLSVRRRRSNKAEGNI